MTNRTLVNQTKTSKVNIKDTSHVTTVTDGRVFKESAEQRFPLSVFLAQPLPYFRQTLRSLGSAFNTLPEQKTWRRQCQQRVVIC